MSIDMGFYQPEWTSFCLKRKFRWKFIIPSISADGVSSLPPSKAARPNFTFKTMEAQHLNEVIYYPSKPEWKPVSLTLYDNYQGFTNPIFEWITYAYNPRPCGGWTPAIGGIKCAYAFIELYDGCGNLLERWVLEHVWPESVEWGDLDFSASEVVTCDVSLRYDRAYLDNIAFPQYNPLFPVNLTDSCVDTLPTDINVPLPLCANTAVPDNLEPPPPANMLGPIQNVPERRLGPKPPERTMPQTTPVKSTKKKFLVRK